MNDKTVVILVADGYEDLEVWYPRLRLLEAGCTVITASGDGRTKSGKYGYPCDAATLTTELSVAACDAVIIPGGIKGAELLRMDPAAVAFVRSMHQAGKIVASICHGAWVLISAFIVRERKLTCFVGMKDDLIAAGAHYRDAEVLVDANLITARMPADLPAFLREILKRLALPSPCHPPVGRVE